MRPLSVVLVAVAAALVAGCGDDDPAAVREVPARIAFTASRAGTGSVVLIDADGRNRVRLLRAARSPAWAPDGQHLAVVRERGEDTDLALVSAGGSGLRSLTGGPDRDADPAFAPDGRSVAFSRQTSGGDEPPHAAILVISADGGDARRVTSGQALDTGPAWSPDGRRLAFTRVSFRAGRPVAAVYVVDAWTGGGERRLVEGDGAAWSPDGRLVAYVTGRDRRGRTCFSECVPSGEIHVVGADGRGDRRLTRSPADDGDPAWTAGGRLVFSSDRSDRLRHDRELYVMGRRGECVTRITNASSASLEPAWRPGGAGRTPCDREGLAVGARRGLVDVDLGAARRYSAHDLLWLGRRHRGLLLSAAPGVAGGQAFVYDDCGRPRGACPPGVEVQVRPLCSWREGPAPARLRRIGRERGAPLYALARDRSAPGPVWLHTADAAVQVHASNRDALDRALRDLRPFDGPRGRRLAPPARTCT